MPTPMLCGRTCVAPSAAHRMGLQLLCWCCYPCSRSPSPPEQWHPGPPLLGAAAAVRLHPPVARRNSRGTLEGGGPAAGCGRRHSAAMPMISKCGVWMMTGYDIQAWIYDLITERYILSASAINRSFNHVRRRSISRLGQVQAAPCCMAMRLVSGNTHSRQLHIKLADQPSSGCLLLHLIKSPLYSCSSRNDCAASRCVSARTDLDYAFHLVTSDHNSQCHICCTHSVAVHRVLLGHSTQLSDTTCSITQPHT
jgi:hypothetical protein